MAIPGSGKRRISPQLHAGAGGQARRPLRYPGGGYSGRLHPVSAPGRRSLPPQIPGGKRLEPSAACRPRKGQPDKHPLLGEWTKDHQSEVLLPSGGKPWFRFSIYASYVRYGNFSPVKRKSSSASHDMWQRRRAFVMESFCFNYSDIRSILHNTFLRNTSAFTFQKAFSAVPKGRFRYALSAKSGIVSGNSTDIYQGSYRYLFYQCLPQAAFRKEFVPYAPSA
mgnify:CR=1 FL=1